MIEKTIDKCQQSNNTYSPLRHLGHLETLRIFSALAVVVKLFLHCMPANAAECFFSDAEIRSNDMLRKALQEFRILFCKIFIALFSGQADVCIQSFLVSKSMIVVQFSRHLNYSWNFI